MTRLDLTRSPGGGVPAAPLVIRTADLPAARKVDSWVALTNGVFTLEHDRFADDFDGSLTVRSFGAVLAADVVCGRVDCKRSPATIARRPMDAYFIFEQLDASGSVFRIPGHADGAMAAGDMVLGDADTPFESFTDSGFAHRVWLFPRPMVDEIGGFDGALARGLHVARDKPNGRLLAAYLAEMQAQWSLLGADRAEAYAGVAARLLTLAAGGDRGSEPARDALAGGELAIVKRRIEQRLVDPLLSPGRIAADCGMSVRKLHALFQPTGDTFSSFVTRRRLALAYAALADPRHAFRPVADIAFGTGFNSLSAFYRAFRDAYGCAPGDIRAEMEQSRG